MRDAAATGRRSTRRDSSSRPRERIGRAARGERLRERGLHPGHHRGREPGPSRVPRARRSRGRDAHGAQRGHAPPHGLRAGSGRDLRGPARRRLRPRGSRGDPGPGSRKNASPLAVAAHGSNVNGAVQDLAGRSRRPSARCPYWSMRPRPRASCPSRPRPGASTSWPARPTRASWVPREWGPATSRPASR